MQVTENELPKSLIKCGWERRSVKCKSAEIEGKEATKLSSYLNAAIRVSVIRSGCESSTEVKKNNSERQTALWQPSNAFAG